MSNRTDFDNVAAELCEMYGLAPDAVDTCDSSTSLRARMEAELHDAFVAGQEHEDPDELREAFAEALGRWQSLADDPDAPTRQRLDDDTRIAELRAEFILGRGDHLAALSFPKPSR